MKIDNVDDIIRIKKTLYISAFLFIAVIATTFMTDFYTTYLFPIPSFYYTTFFSIIFVSFLVIRSLRKYYFVYYSDEGNILNIRFYRITTISPKFLSIEIPKNALHKIEIESTFMDLRKNLFLFQITKKGISKYPPISLTALSKAKQKQLIESLKSYSKVTD